MCCTTLCALEYDKCAIWARIAKPPLGNTDYWNYSLLLAWCAYVRLSLSLSRARFLHSILKCVLYILGVCLMIVTTTGAQPQMRAV